MKKLLALLLAVVLFIGVFAGCSKTDNSSKTVKTASINTESLYPVVTEPVTLTLAIGVGPTNEDPNNMWFFKYMKEKTGVDTDYMVIQNSAWDEKKPIMLATDDLPDIFLGLSFNTTEIMKYGKAGSFIPLNGYIDLYGDMIKEKIDMVDGAWTGIHCPDGNIYSLPSLTISFQASGNALSINHEWLKNVGMDFPTTLDEFYNVMKAFKEQDANGNGDPNDEIPISGSSTERPFRGQILDAFGLILESGSKTNMGVTRDGKAVYVPLSEKYKDYLTYMNKLWSEGLIDPDYYTQDLQAVYAKGEKQLFGVYTNWAPYYFTSKWADWTVISPLVENSGDKPLTFYRTPYNPGRLTVTKACKNPDVAVRWLNLFYTPEVCKRLFYGPEYGSDEDTEGKGTILYPEEDGSMHEEVPAWNPDEIGLWDWYCTVNGPGNCMFSCALDEGYQFEVLYGADPFKSALPEESLWRLQYLDNVADNRTLPYPPVYLSEENVNRVDELATALNTYVETMEAKFIIGTEPLSNYDAFVSELKRLGAEEYEKIYVDAYEAYLANK